MRIFLTIILLFVCNPYVYAQESIDEELTDEEWESVGGYPSVKGQTVEQTVKIEELTEPKVEYHYSPFGKSSPFAAPMILDRKKGTRSSGSGSRKPTPLTENPLEAYRFVGIWRANGGKPRTLIMTPSGAGIVAVEGSAIGNREGKVLRIFETKVIVREYEDRPDGTREYEDITFNITGDASKGEINDKSDEKLKTSKILSH